jgi:hypothetical protein
LEQLYGGRLFLFSRRAIVEEFAAHARAMIQEAFGGLDPLRAQHHLKVEDFYEVVAKLKPAFIHHPRSKDLIRKLVTDFGCDLDTTYIDVPRLRIGTSHGYLTSGVAYAHHPHRDTWYSAPASQINWWLPVYEFVSESSMAFHCRYFDRAVANTSNEFNYYDWNTNGRANASKHVTSDTRNQPKATEPIKLDPQIRLVFPVGGVLQFSAQQMHSTVPNTSGLTRWSIDFRTVDINDVRAKRGARTPDARCTGTSLRDFVRASDLERMPEEIAALYDDTPEKSGVRVYIPT